ncbi:MAG: BRO-N domain-containing protein, partial [Cetobacterium sp.]
MSENQITRIFENHPIFLLKEVDENDKTQFYFKAADVAKVLDIVNIHSSTQHFNEKEKAIREMDTIKGIQKVTMLTSRGVYRLLYASKKPIAEKFRDWASDVLDDIIFNESQELKKQLEEKAKELKQKEIENKKQEKELKQKEIENQKLREKGNWLYEKTVKKVNFKKRIHKNLAIYVASNIFEKENNIFKIGKSVCMKERKSSLRTGSAPDNDFKMHKSYDVVDGLEIATEKYLHALMESFHIDDKANTEHFMAHMEFIDLIVTNVIQHQFHNINLMNDYIKVLDKHKFNFEAAKPDMVKFVEKSKTRNYNNETQFAYDMKQTTKVCQTCSKNVPIFKFEGENCA